MVNRPFGPGQDAGGRGPGRARVQEEVGLAGQGTVRNRPGRVLW